MARAVWNCHGTRRLELSWHAPPGIVMVRASEILIVHAPEIVMVRAFEILIVRASEIVIVSLSNDR
jgi:hypothetical protein